MNRQQFQTILKHFRICDGLVQTIEAGGSIDDILPSYRSSRKMMLDLLAWLVYVHRHTGHEELMDVPAGYEELLGSNERGSSNE